MHFSPLSFFLLLLLCTTETIDVTRRNTKESLMASEQKKVSARYAKEENFLNLVQFSM